MSLEHRKQVEIRWRDVDAFSHVNNAVYLTYLEEARDEWLARAVGDARIIEGFVLARVAIDYRSQLRQDDDVVEVAVRLQAVGRSSVTTAEEVRVVSTGRLAAEAEAVLVRYDWKTERSRPLEDSLRERFAASAAR